MHGCANDIAWLQQLGIYTVNVFDTEKAAQVRCHAVLLQSQLRALGCTAVSTVACACLQPTAPCSRTQPSTLIFNAHCNTGSGA